MPFCVAVRHSKGTPKIAERRDVLAEKIDRQKPHDGGDRKNTETQQHGHKARITYGDNVPQTVLNEYVTRTRTNAGIIRKEYTRVQFDCRCQACGTEKIIVQDFCTGVVTVNGSSTARSEDRNLDTEIFLWWM